MTPAEDGLQTRLHAAQIHGSVLTLTKLKCVFFYLPGSSERSAGKLKKLVPEILQEKKIFKVRLENPPTEGEADTFIKSDFTSSYPQGTRLLVLNLLKRHWFVLLGPN